VAHNAALGLSNRGNDAHGGRRSGEIPIAAPDCDRSITGHVGAVWQHQSRDGVTRGETVMTTILGQIKDLPIGQPGQLRRELVPLAQRCGNGHRKSVFQDARDLSLERYR
jgi:hypothetical protein